MEPIKYSISRQRKIPVDIIIPFHGQYEKVANLVNSIFIYTKNTSFQIYLVDDASPNEHFFEEFKKIDENPPAGCEPIVQVTRNKKQLGFGGALEVGFRATKQPYVVFLNSDCLVETTTWLSNMLNTLLKLKNQNVKMVSSTMDNCSNSSLVNKRGEIKSDFILGEKEFLPLVSVICHRELFNHIGGFIKNYPFGWYEDEELAFRMKKHGYKQGVSGSSWIKHFGELTLKELWKNNPDSMKIMESNYNLCLKDIQSTS